MDAGYATCASGHQSILGDFYAAHRLVSSRSVYEAASAKATEVADLRGHAVSAVQILPMLGPGRRFCPAL
jgi:hypothetical protein